MNIERAREVLGVLPDAGLKALEESLVLKRKELTDRLHSAPTEALKKKYTDSLSELNQAYELLKPRDFNVPEIPGLSKSAVMDLPGAMPFYTKSDEQSGNQGAQILKPGDVLMERYEVRRLIGSGGMGAVYAAYDRNTDQEIAIKVLLPALMKDDRSRERFFTEGRISRQLSHASILNVYDINKNADLYFISMDLLQGRTLRGEMNARKARGASFSVEEVLNLAHTISDALSYAHEYTIHRDIKPENIFITSDEKIKLMDFGLARLQSQSQLTRTGVAMGTAYYMAPEQLEGSKDIDGRADQYSLAVVMYELFTGSVPVGRVKSVYLRRPDVPRELSDALDKALDGDPKERFPTMKGFSEALRIGKKVAAPPPVREAPAKTTSKKLPSHKPLALGGIAIVLVCAVSYGLYFRSAPEKEASPAAQKTEPKVEEKKDDKALVPTALPTLPPTKVEARGVVSILKQDSSTDANLVPSTPALEKMADTSILEKLNRTRGEVPDIDAGVGEGSSSVTIRKIAEKPATDTAKIILPQKTPDTIATIENPASKLLSIFSTTKPEPTLSQVALLKKEDLPADTKAEILPEVKKQVPELKPTVFEMDPALIKLRGDAIAAFGEWKRVSQNSPEKDNPRAKVGEQEFSKGEDASRVGDRVVATTAFQRSKDIFDGLVVSLKMQKSATPLVKQQGPRPIRNNIKKLPPTRRPFISEPPPPPRIFVPESNQKPAPRRRRNEPVD